MNHRQRKLLSTASYSIYSLPARLRTWATVRLWKRSEALEIRKARGELVGDVAIVAVFPRIPLIPSVERLLVALTDNGFTVVLVVNSTEDSERCLARWEALSAHVLVRPNVGRDFGAYQAGVRYLIAYADLPHVDRVAFFNDSVFYPPAVSRPLSEWLASPEPTSALFINFEERVHLQSFAFYVSGSALLDERSAKFWQNYYPSNQRVHAINKGEAKLTKALLHDGSLLGSYLSWHKLDAALDGNWESLRPADISALRSMAGPATTDPYMEAVIDRSKPWGDPRRNAELAAVFLTTRNSSLGLGPLSARVLALPLKLDLVKQGFLTFAGYEATLLDCKTEPSEVESVMTLMKTSGSIASAVGFKRLWRDFGHY